MLFFFAVHKYASNSLDDSRIALLIPNYFTLSQSVWYVVVYLVHPTLRSKISTLTLPDSLHKVFLTNATFEKCGLTNIIYAHSRAAEPKRILVLIGNAIYHFRVIELFVKSSIQCTDNLNSFSFSTIDPSYDVIFATPKSGNNFLKLRFNFAIISPQANSQGGVSNLFVIGGQTAKHHAPISDTVTRLLCQRSVTKQDSNQGP